MWRSLPRLIFPRTVPSMRTGSIPLIVPSTITSGPKYVCPGVVVVSTRACGFGGGTSFEKRAMGFLAGGEHNMGVQRLRVTGSQGCRVPGCWVFVCWHVQGTVQRLKFEVRHKNAEFRRSTLVILVSNFELQSPATQQPAN